MKSKGAPFNVSYLYATCAETIIPDVTVLDEKN